jgi:hypothetical protein
MQHQEILIIAQRYMLRHFPWEEIIVSAVYVLLQEKFLVSLCGMFAGFTYAAHPWDEIRASAVYMYFSS